MENPFNTGDRVSMMCGELKWEGVVTIPTSDGHCKVMFDDWDGPDYTYYPITELTLIPEKKDE